MSEKVNNSTFYHVHGSVSYNENAPLIVGQVLSIGEAYNPFFAYYKNVATYPVTAPDGSVSNYSAMAFLNGVLAKRIQSNIFPQIACEVAQHYLLLSRELIMEEVRKQEAPQAPSRQTCMWVVESQKAAQYWQKRLGTISKIVEMELTGVIHRADARLLLADSEPLEITYERARSYWRGQTSLDPEPEVLFKGTAIVKSIIP